MATVILARHGRTTANATGVLAGRTPGVALDEVGQSQALRAGERLKDLTLTSIRVSPQQRCAQTAELIDQGRGVTATHHTDPRLDECDYGTWQGGTIADLVTEPLWRTIQDQPSAARFPEGESLVEMSQRAIQAVRTRDEELTRSSGGETLWLAVSHGDVIKAVLADALGMHLDLFQRIRIDPGSLSVIRYTPQRTEVLTMNSSTGDLGWLASAPDSSPQQGTPGGGAGHE